MRLKYEYVFFELNARVNGALSEINAPSDSAYNHEHHVRFSLSETFNEGTAEDCGKCTNPLPPRTGCLACSFLEFGVLSQVL